MEFETDPKDTARLRHLARACEKHLQMLSQDEEAQEGTTKTRDSYWASRKLAKFNIWCAEVGVNSEGPQSIDVRLEGAPEICKLIGHLLQSLGRDLNELQQPAEVPAQISNADNNVDDVEPDDSSSFESLSSYEGSRGQSATGHVASTRSLALRRRIGDTIARLHRHARRIECAGSKHRWERMEIYREKKGPKWAYEGFKKLATREANEKFKLASDTIRQRIAESFARRRIRFEYLREHRKKRAVDMCVQEQISTRDSQLERAESVASVALRHPGFPPLPKTCGSSFQCPYCRLEFHAREAERDHWSQHVMQDFEPYFCTLEDCKAPFDVPNTFNGLLGHLQDHLPVRYQVDMPGGEHGAFDETEFEEYIERHAEIYEETTAIMKEPDRWKGEFLLECCPFCGGYPDDFEKRYPDPNILEAQTELQKHIKQHMQDIALFCPPYREDIFNEDDDPSKGSIVTVTSPRSVNQSNSGELDECKTSCDQQDCDCKDKGKYAAEDASAAESTRWPDLEAEEDSVSWSELFSDSPLYDRSSVSDNYYFSDERLRPFVARLELGPSSDPQTRSPVFVHNSDYTIETKDTIYGRTPLSRAAENGYEAVVKLLLEKGAELDTKDVCYCRTQLLRAAESGHEVAVVIVKLLLKKCAELETKEFCYGCRTPPLPVVGNAYEMGVKIMLEKGAELEEKNPIGRTLLSQAAEGGHKAAVELLLERGAEIDTKDNFGETPLFRAADGGYEAVVELLFEKGAELNTKDANGQTPLSRAVRNGHEAVVKLLLEKGVELETRDRFFGRTPLLHAAEVGNEAIVKLLLEKGAELEAKNALYGRTPLSQAAERGHEAIVKLLLEKGSELETKDDCGRAPLSLAATNGHEAVVELLLEKGSELEMKDRSGQTALSRTAENGRKAIVKLLLEKGSELETKDALFGWTPLSLAAANGHEAVVELLLEKGSELEMKDRNGQTPLSQAAENGHEAVVKLLVEKGAELKTDDAEGQTPLSRAAEKGHEGVMKLLVEKGAELMMNDYNG